MDTSDHSLSTLFVQLGLPGDQASIDQFIHNHCLPPGVSVADAPFWTPGQAEFLRESIADDSDWSEVVDDLDTRLH